MVDLVPHLYLDTNVILDILHPKRHASSVDLLQKIREKKWRCSTSSYSLLEMYDAEQLEKYVQKLHLQGYDWSQIMRRTR